jgi:uncharacterized membrane protein
VTSLVVALLIAGAVLATGGALGSRRRRSLTWLALAVGAIGVVVVAFEIWFGATQSR